MYLQQKSSLYIWLKYFGHEPLFCEKFKSQIISYFMRWSHFIWIWKKSKTYLIWPPRSIINMVLKISNIFLFGGIVIMEQKSNCFLIYLSCWNTIYRPFLIIFSTKKTKKREGTTTRKTIQLSHHHQFKKWERKTKSQNPSHFRDILVLVRTKSSSS